jgi:phosphoribosylanthranilate isomerase
MTAIKICGITRMEDARIALQLGVQYLGFIFSDSPRRVSALQAARITRRLPGSIQKVGVFVNEDEARIRSIAEETALDLIQLHGEEPPELCSRFELPVIKVIRTSGKNVFEKIECYETDLFLLEPYVPNQAGGTGKRADWKLARRIVDSFPARRFILAGGLNPENVASAIRSVAPFAVDASSGLEDSPGVKNHDKIYDFVNNVRNL